MIDIEIQVIDREVLLRLDDIPRRLRSALRSKFEALIEETKQQLLNKVPGKYIDPKYIEFGTQDVGSSLVVGFVEAEEKPGVYAIFPVKASVLRFIAKSGDLVFTKQVLRHPYPKASESLARQLLELKPWLESQLSDIDVEL